MNPIKAIIVDDEPNARKALRGMLNEHFEEVLVLADCGNVPEAVKMINRFKPDLIFLDIDMPVIVDLSCWIFLMNSRFGLISSLLLLTVNIL